jgi:dienelactone hydrolase
MKSLLVVAAVLVSAAQIIWASPSVALEGRHDAFAALAHLRMQPFVDARRIGVMGFSYGATATLRLTSSRYRGADHPRPSSFGAAVALYPSLLHG